MSFNGSGLFLIDSAGQPVVANTLIQSSVFNAFTADIATGLSNCMTKDGQTTATANIPMGGFVLTGLGAGSANGHSVRYEQLLAYAPRVCEFRLSLATGESVTTTDLINKTTVYFTPHKGNQIALYDSANWIMYSSAEMSIAVPAVASKMYDVFCYAALGVPTLELTAWTNDTTRATALTLQDGVLVKSGATTRRYVGSFRTNSINAVNDSAASRSTWNYYNRVLRHMRITEATNSWNYSTATIRQANGSATNQLDLIVGVSEDVVSAQILAIAADTAAGNAAGVGIGLDSTTEFTSGGLFQNVHFPTNNLRTILTASWKGYPGVGRHLLCWNEVANTSGTTTWYGDNNAPTLLQSGIHGDIWC